jgi:hypothetical protein
MTQHIGGLSVRQRIRGAGLLGIAVAVVLALAGCTGGDADRQSTAASGTTPTTAPASGRPSGTTDSGTAGSGMSGSGTAGSGAADSSTAGSSAQDGPAAGGAVTTVIGTATTVITAPTADDPLGDVTTHQPGAVESAAATVLPGLYGLDSLGATVHGSTVELTAQGGCGFVRDVIGAGQWALTPVIQPHDDVPVYLGVLSRGDRSALLSLKEYAGLCTGRISAATAQQLSLSGTISAAGPAQAVTIACLAQVDEDQPPAHVVVVSYRTADAALAAIVTVPDAVGTHPVDPDDQAGLIRFDPHRPALVQAATMAKAFFDYTAITPDAMLPGVDEHNAWFQGEGASVTVTSSDPLTGILKAPHLVRESGGGSAAFTAGFSC